MKSIPRLSWLNAKQYKQAFGDRKNTPGRKPELIEALAENEARGMVLTPNPTETPIENTGISE